MATYTSGSIYFNGLTETDFDTMISQLKEIEQTQMTRLTKWKSEWQLRMAAFEELRTELVNLQGTLNKLNSLNAFMTKTVSSSNSSALTATANANATEGSYSVEVNQVATNAVWSLDLNVSSPKDSINDTTDTQYFVYEYQGKEVTVEVPPNTTLEGLQNLINNNSANPGVKVNIISGAGGYSFQIRGTEVGASNSLYVRYTNVEAFTNSSGGFGNYAVSGGDGTKATDDIITDGSATSDIKFSYKGVDYTYTASLGDTWADFATYVGGIAGGDIGVSWDIEGNIVLTGDNPDDRIIFDSDNEYPPSWTISSALPVGTGWESQKAQNAQVRVDGFPSTGWYEFESNTISDVIEGVTFTVKDETTPAKVILTVEVDTEGITENVQTFLDAVNAVRTKIQELTDFDETKQVLDPEFADNQFEMQQGSILTGNYGVQLISTQLKQMIASTPPGFQALINPGTTDQYGDVYSTLAQLGIKTDSDKGSATYGLLVMVQSDDSDSNHYSTLPSFSDALKANPQAVAEFFALAEKGVSDSANFSYYSHITNITEPGTYDVVYTTDSSGNVIGGTINGKEAKWDPATQQLSLVRSGPSATSGSSASATAEENLDGSWRVDVSQVADNASDTVNLTGIDPTAEIFSSGFFEFDYQDADGNTQTQTIVFDPADPMSLSDLVKEINSKSGKTGVVASYVSDGSGGYDFTINTAESGADMAIAVRTDQTDLGNGSWSATGAQGQDAVFQVFEVDADGNDITPPIFNSSSADGTWTSPDGVTFKAVAIGSTSLTAQADNPADGLVIVLHNFTPDTTFDSSNDSHNTVRIKQGLVNSVLTLLNGPASNREEGMLGAKGALGILKSNYQTIIDNINTKITKENERVEKWERMIRERFSRLQATITTYNGLNTTLESLIGQLGNS